MPFHWEVLSLFMASGPFETDGKEESTMKSLSCKDVEGAKCDWSVCGKTEEEILAKAREHAQKEHNLSEIPQELLDKARAAIREGC